ncbi:MAG: TPP-dependent pyruvate/acetoin dehydrogenase alpha subunit [Oceanospirillaceae bacterium]
MDERISSELELQDMQTQCSAQVEQSVAQYLAMPAQPISAIFEYMYQEMPSALKQQLNQLEQSLDSEV